MKEHSEKNNDKKIENDDMNTMSIPEIKSIKNRNNPNNPTTILKKKEEEDGKEK